MGNVGQGKPKSSSASDVAIAIFPTAASNCSSLTGAQTSGSVSYDASCNFIINGKDMDQAFAATFQDCMSMCSATTGCDAVSFDASLTQGFKNCYMKTGVVSSDLIADQGIDTAILSNNAVDADPAPVPDTSSPVVPLPSVAPVRPKS